MTGEKKKYDIIKNYDFNHPKKALLYFGKGHSASLQAAFPNANFTLSK